MRPSPLLAALVSLSVCLAAAPEPAGAAHNRAFATTSDFTTGTLCVVDLDTRVVTRDVVSVGADATPCFYDGLVYVVNRFGGDNIQVIDPASNYTTIRQFSVGNGSNPQDIVFVSPTKAYVSRYGSSDLLVVNPADPNGLPQTPISLAEFADTDGVPEMAHMALVHPYLFVACQRLTNFQPVNPSVVVVVDVRADTVFDVDPVTAGTQAISLAAPNPVTRFALHAATSALDPSLYLGLAGSYGALDGGIERIHPVTLHRTGLLVTDAQLGGDLAAIAWHSPTRAFAIAGTFDQQRLIGWDPSTAVIIDTLLSANGGFSIPEMALNDRGELWVCRNPTPPAISKPPGLLVYDAATGAALSDLLETGLTPMGIAFGEVIAPAPVPGGLAMQAPHPNPVARLAHVEFNLAAESRVRVAVFDLTGRRVRSYDLGTRTAGQATLDWNLTGEDGRPVPNGLYVIRVEAAGKTSSRRIAVVR